jgi:hypothetical protein
MTGEEVVTGVGGRGWGGGGECSVAVIIGSDGRTAVPRHHVLTSQGAKERSEGPAISHQIHA